MAFASSTSVPIRGFQNYRARCSQRTARDVRQLARPARVVMASGIPNALHDRVFIKVDEKANETAGGLVLPSASGGKEKTGVVVKVGPGRFSPQGAREPMTVEVGDHVLWKDDFGSETIEVGGEKVLALRVPSIVAKWK